MSYEDFFQSKDVILLGGGFVDYSLFKQNHYDIICCTNNHILKLLENEVIKSLDIFKEDKKIVLYHSGCDIDHDLFKLDFQFSKIISFESFFDVFFNPLKVNDYLCLNQNGENVDWYSSLYGRLKGVPLTGILALAHLVRMPILELTITGFDFYVDEYEQNLVNSPYGLIPKRDAHQLLPQVLYLCEQIKKDFRLKVDRNLLAAIRKYLCNIEEYNQNDYVSLYNFNY